jgi:hypothetical protein
MRIPRSRAEVVTYDMLRSRIQVAIDHLLGDIS